MTRRIRSSARCRLSPIVAAHRDRTPPRRPARRASSTTTIRSPASRKRRTRRRSREWDIDLFYDLAENLFGQPGDTDPQRARAQHQHHRRGSRFELVHQSHSRPAAVGRRGRARTAHGQRTGTGHLVRRPAQAGRVRAGLHDARREGGDVVRVVRREGLSPKRRPARFSSPTRSSGRWATGRSRTTWSRVRPDQLVDRRVGDSAAAVRQGRGRCGAATSRTCCAASHRSADGSYRAVAARAVPGRPLGGFRYYGTRPDDPNDIVPHEHRRELRALKVFGAWTNLVDMKAGNTLDTLVTDERRGRRPALSAGCRLDVRHRRERAARVRRRVGIAVRGRSRAEAADHAGLLPAAVADGAVREQSGDRPVRGRRVRSRRMEAARADRRVPARPRRRLVLGGAPGDGVLRRDDPRDRQDGTVQRSASRAAAGRRADPAPRQDRSRVSERDQPGGQRRARRQRRR